MLTKIDKAISMYEARLRAAVEDAGQIDGRPGVGTISLLQNDLAALYVMRQELDEAAARSRRAAERDEK